MSQKKIKYEKPKSMNVGRVASVLGATCSVGDGALDGCGWGNDPTSVPYCDQGAIATGNCFPHGGSAGQSCHVGDSAGW